MNKELLSSKELNVLGTPLQSCSCNPLTGWFRDGFCHFDSNDRGNHSMCCIMDNNFLNYSKSQGNDLITPMTEYSFPGLKEGDKWCICLNRWKQAKEDGLAPLVILESTNIIVLNDLPLEELKKYQYIKNQ